MSISTEMLFDEFGNQTISGNSTFLNEVTFTGAIADSTGLYYMNARFYNPNTGRFLTQDTYKGNAWEPMSQHLYSYVGNNPINYIDPTGHWGENINWSQIGQGALMVGIGVLAVAAVVATGGAAAAVIAPALVGTFGAGATVVAAVAVGSVALAGGVTSTIGLAEIGEGLTGENIIKDTVGEEAYQWTAEISMLYATMGAYYLGTLAAGSTSSSSSTNSNECFVAGTLITTSDGIKNIENIQVGDMVLAENPESGKQEFKRVLQVFINKTDAIVKIEVGGEVIETTEEHPFWIEGKGWVEAEKLEVGNAVRLSNGDNVIIDFVKITKLKEFVTVYNFEVEGFHTYYVAAIGVLVHNDCQRGVGGHGWRGDADWKNNVKTVGEGGTITELNGGVPTVNEALDLIDEAGGVWNRAEFGHFVGGNPHNYPHINYTTAHGLKGTLKLIELLEEMTNN